MHWFPSSFTYLKGWMYVSITLNTSCHFCLIYRSVATMTIKTLFCAFRIVLKPCMEKLRAHCGRVNTNESASNSLFSIPTKFLLHINMSGFPMSKIWREVYTVGQWSTYQLWKSGRVHETWPCITYTNVYTNKHAWKSCWARKLQCRELLRNE